MRQLHGHIRRVLCATVGAAALVVPASALADCATAVDTAAFRGTVAQYYPQGCYTAGLKKLGGDVNTYSPNVGRNLRSAMRRDRTRKLTFTIVWLPDEKAIVTSNLKLKSGLQLRKGNKILARASINGKATRIKLKRTGGKLTVTLIWTLGKRTITIAKRVPHVAVAAHLTMRIQWLTKGRVRIRSNAVLAGAVQLRRGKKVIARGRIDGTATTLKLRKTPAPLTVALIWVVGRQHITITKPARAA